MKCSLHVHTTFSDGSGSILENIESAKKLGIDELGISDHFHLSLDGSHLSSDMLLENFERYVSEVLSFSNLEKPKVRLGLEVEYVPKTLEKLKKALANVPLDYLIGSIHGIDDKWRIDYKPEALPPDFCSTIMRTYWMLLKEMVESKVFDIVGHIDLVKKFGYKPTVDLSKEIEDALLAISRSGMVVELNTSGWYFPCKEQYPSLEILKKCVGLKIPLMVTADSHRPENLSRGFDRAFEILRNLGVSKQAYFVKRKLYSTPLP